MTTEAKVPLRAKSPTRRADRARGQRGEIAQMEEALGDRSSGITSSSWEVSNKT